MTRTNLRVSDDEVQSMDDMMANLVAVKGEGHASLVRCCVAIKQIGGVMAALCQFAPDEAKDFAFDALAVMGAEMIGEVRRAHGIESTPEQREAVAVDAHMVYEHGRNIAQRVIQQKGH